MTDYVDPLSFPSGQQPIPKNLNKSIYWLDWITRLIALFRQIRIGGAGTLDFPNTPAFTSSAELGITFTLGGQDVPLNSFIKAVRVLDPVTGLPVDQPANSFFTYRMYQDNGIAVRFNNFSAVAINPPAYTFEFLIELRLG